MRVSKSIIRKLAMAACLALAPCGFVQPAMAKPLSNIIPNSVAVTFQATIKAIDPATREITLVGPTGETETVVAGPVVRLEMLKAGDTVNVKYYRSVAFYVSSSAEKVPENQVDAALARPVTAPGGVALKQTVISGTVVGIDLAAKTLELVNPKGGGVVTVEVTDPVRRAHLPLLKVGDTITAVISEALAVTVEPAK